MRRRESARVLGPYKEGATWRIIHLDGNGRRTSHRLGDEQEALKLKRKILRRIESEPQITLGELIDRYVVYLSDVRAVKPASVDVVRSSLHRFFNGTLMRSPIFTKEAAEAWYKAHTQRTSQRDKPFSVATHHLDLKVARRLYLWAAKKGLLRDNPWQGIETIGRPRVGKVQLRVDEARRLVDGALTDLHAGDTDTLAPLLALLMGLRASEVMGRTARDVDDGGRLLWIDSGKTDHSRRHLRVPAVLAPHLAQLAAQQKAEPYLFGASLDGGPPTHRLTSIVRRLCRRHDVPRVCPHSLRGLYATLAMEQGAVADMVAASLGHTSFAMTARHYAQPQAVRHAKTERVLAVLDRSAAHEREEAAAHDPRGTTAVVEMVDADFSEAVVPAVVEIMPEPLSVPSPGTGMASLAELLTAMGRTQVTTHSPVIACLSGLTRHKPARVLGPYKNRSGYRLIVVDGPQRKALVAPTKEQAEALRDQITTVINHSRTLPNPKKT